MTEMVKEMQQAHDAGIFVPLIGHYSKHKQWFIKTKCILECGFILACEDFGRMFDHSFPAYAFFCLL